MNNNNISPQYNKIITVKKRETNRRGNYILGETIGKGAFAKVELATHIPTQEKVAIKILDKQKLSHNHTNDDVVRIKKEINILKQLRHKNIIQLYEIIESQSNLYIVMEYCEGKELFDYIIKRKHLPEREACRLFQQIINGVEYLHLMNVTHRDLKPENLLLDSKRRIKISDFGLSTITQNPNSLLQTPCGTPSYAPPEMLRGDEYNGVESDIWSCGIILFTMLCGNLPCAESKEELIYQTLVTHNYDFPSFVSPLAVDLINNMLKVDPSERYNFEQIKMHPWFHLIQPQLKPGLLVGTIKIPIDEEVLAKVEGSGFDREKCKESIRENKYDSFTAFYYLSLKQMSREGKSSISDLFSDKYVSYIKEKNNWENEELKNNFAFRDYWDDEKIKSEKIRYELINGKKENNSNGHTQRDYKEAKKKIVSLMGHNSKSNAISLQLSSDPLPQDVKDKITEMLNKSNDEFNKQIEHINILDDLPFKTANDNKKTHSGTVQGSNIIKLIANKLIKTSIFGKYLTNINKKPQNLKIPIRGEIVDKFYTLQKYKNLVEIIKSRRIGILPKQIYDWNYYTFDEFLNDEEDYVFTDSFVKSSTFTPFIQKIKKTMRKPINNNYHRNSIGKNHAQTRYASADRYHLKRSNILNNSAYYSRTKKITLSSHPKKRVNKFISISSYIHDNSVERNNSQTSQPQKTSYNTYKKVGNKEKVTSYTSAKKQAITPFRFKISTSTMNDISEDEEIFSFNNNNINNTCDTHRKTSLDMKSNLVALVTEGNETNRESPYKPTTGMMTDRTNEEIIDSIKQFKAEIQLAKPKISKPHTKSVVTMGNRMNGNNNGGFTGPIDLKCIMPFEFNEIVSQIKGYFKKLDYFYNIKGNKIKCSKANLTIDIEITKINFSFASEVNYLKIKLRTGESGAYQKIINEFLNTF